MPELEFLNLQELQRQSVDALQAAALKQERHNARVFVAWVVVFGCAIAGCIALDAKEFISQVASHAAQAALVFTIGLAFKAWESKHWQKSNQNVEPEPSSADPRPSPRSSCS